MKSCYSILITFILISGSLFAQKTVSGKKINHAITLDGMLLEVAWDEGEKATDFINNYPDPGNASRYKSEVTFLYDDQYIYIGAKLVDNQPDSIIAFLSERDDFGNADWFGVLIDPYGAGQNAFGFYVTAAGTELDAIINQTTEDFSWNAVWRSKVKRISEGWSIEIRIPLTQLRFPKELVQNWRINYVRNVRRNRETSHWSAVDPQQYGEIAQSGYIKGIENLGSPLRLSFSPYSTIYLEDSYDENKQRQDWGFRPRLGMDMKLGLSESFTLDATLIPDFGQTVSDRLVLNLSPFEVRYPENRPFFLEGMDLFGIGDLFYSRRIGAESYLKYEAVDSASKDPNNRITSVPDRAQLINALKISGRTKGGLGIGVFNAIENKSFLHYEDSAGNDYKILAHPVSNYNVFVLSQNLKNNANISFLNTNVFRPEINLISNISTLEGLVFNKSRDYSLSGNTKISLNSIGNSMTVGRSSSLSFRKVKGAHRFNIDYYDSDHKYNSNELGFLARNNFLGFNGEYFWTGYKATKKLLRRNLSVESTLEYLYKPTKIGYWSINTEYIITTKKFLSTGVSLNLYPLGEHDFFESRSFGIPVHFPASFQYGGFYSSDYSKRFALDFFAYHRIFDRKEMSNLDLNLSPRIRITPKIFTVLSSSVSRFFNNFGYVRVTDTNYTDQITLGNRERWVVTNSISLDYNFTKTFGLKLRFNHYWQEVAYKSFMELHNDGSYTSSSYIGVDSLGQSYHNTSFNAFTVDFDLRWVIYPGSEIRFVWKYNIYASKQGLDEGYFNTFRNLFDNPYLNSFSVKALFYIDAGKWFRKKVV
ncbi:DUF5916 domain-containing protein [Fluviicola taffensis]|uniref:DUF5916 domain-containing protein n=1 Tax=Fluviicola taffensis (strain DSM 16823 / NCIMB 13979 / RW262) TaxID=755732 RepID=F2IDC9_FLUTR|nr:DUF5916 domain-containing protein [Fluviicola taffensis]AEA42305.1 hypothetical protein Fluta_0296 [Fluviicola taffensis DSM 16823]